MNLTELYPQNAVDNYIAMTFTLRLNKNQKKKPAECTLRRQAGVFKRHIQQITDNYFTKLNCVFELTKKGNLHSHCIGEINRKYSMKETCIILNIVTTNMLGWCDIAPIQHLVAWIEYMQKDIKMTCNVLSALKQKIDVETLYKPLCTIEVNKPTYGELEMFYRNKIAIDDIIINNGPESLNEFCD